MFLQNLIHSSLDLIFYRINQFEEKILKKNITKTVKSIAMSFQFKNYFGNNQKTQPQNTNESNQSSATIVSSMTLQNPATRTSKRVRLEQRLKEEMEYKRLIELYGELEPMEVEDVYLYEVSDPYNTTVMNNWMFPNTLQEKQSEQNRNLLGTNAGFTSGQSLSNVHQNSTHQQMNSSSLVNSIPNSAVQQQNPFAYCENSNNSSQNYSQFPLVSSGMQSFSAFSANSGFTQTNSSCNSNTNAAMSSQQSIFPSIGNEVQKNNS
jgi:hypothetical protein